MPTPNSPQAFAKELVAYIERLIAIGAFTELINKGHLSQDDFTSIKNAELKHLKIFAENATLMFGQNDAHLLMCYAEYQNWKNASSFQDFSIDGQLLTMTEQDQNFFMLVSLLDYCLLNQENANWTGKETFSVLMTLLKDIESGKITLDSVKSETKVLLAILQNRIKVEAEKAKQKGANTTHAAGGGAGTTMLIDPTYTLGQEYYFSRMMRRGRGTVRVGPLRDSKGNIIGYDQELGDDDII